jgi:hypothetical protein
MTRRVLAGILLVAGLASCGDTETATDTTAPMESSFANDCERLLSKFSVDAVISYGDLAPVKAQWPDNKKVQDLVEAIYLIAKPLVDKVTVGPAVNYMNEVITNSCRDNDVFNWVQNLEEGAAGHKSTCLDGELPADIAKVEPCAEDASASTTTAP